MSARGLTNVDLALLWDRLLCLNGAHALELLHSLCRVQAVKVLCCVVPIESLQDSCTYTTVSARVRACELREREGGGREGKKEERERRERECVCVCVQARDRQKICTHTHIHSLPPSVSPFPLFHPPCLTSRMVWRPLGEVIPLSINGKLHLVSSWIAALLVIGFKKKKKLCGSESKASPRGFGGVSWGFGRQRFVGGFRHARSWREMSKKAILTSAQSQSLYFPKRKVVACLLLLLLGLCLLAGCEMSMGSRVAGWLLLFVSGYAAASLLYMLHTERSMLLVKSVAPVSDVLKCVLFPLFLFFFSLIALLLCQ